MTPGNVQVDQDGPVAVLTLTRPKKLNAVGVAALTELNRVVPAADLMPEAKRLAHALAEKPATALRLLKQALRIGPGMDVGAGLAYERDLNMLCFTLPERLAAMERFLTRRLETAGGQS